MEIRNVFLDTEAYCSSGLAFSTGNLARLKVLARAGSIQLIASDVILGELQGKYSDRAIEIVRLREALKKATRSLADKTPEIIVTALDCLDDTEFEPLFEFQGDDYFDVTNALILSSETVEIATVLELYFSRKPPFANKKKSEFPDAIWLVSLVEWCKKENEKAIVISRDADVVDFCNESEHLESLGSPSDFLDLFNKSDVPESERLVVSLHNREREIVERIEEEFSSKPFLYDPFPHHYDPDSEIDDVRCFGTQIREAKILDVEAEGAVLECIADVNFVATVSGSDYSNAIYDKEDSRYYNVEHFTEDLYFVKDVSVIVHIEFESVDAATSEPFEFEIAEVHLANESEIVLDENDVVSKASGEAARASVYDE